MSGRPKDRPDSCLVNHVDGFLGYGVESGYSLGIGLEGALSNDQV
jgi:hypothetical protein